MFSGDNDSANDRNDSETSLIVTDRASDPRRRIVNALSSLRPMLARVNG